jgi:NitT/TauT family transport system ATP-binding protein
MNKSIAIECQNLKKIYVSKEEELVALENFTLTTYDKEFICVVGASGCGKTTALKIIAGLIGKTEGEIFVYGRPVESPHADTGMVFQHPNLLPWRNVLKNILLPAEIQKSRDEDIEEWHPRAFNLLELVGLKGFANRYPFELSGGMQQRVNLARALITDPSLLLMDEPFGALDAITRDKMNLELLRIWEETKKTIFFITHNIREAIFLSDRVVVMTPRPGRVQKIVDIDLKRPRELCDQVGPKFGDYCSILYDLIQEGGVKISKEGKIT